ncbi:MAG: sugar phosphate isomerase/epimerase [Acidobacteriota bacterium]
MPEARSHIQRNHALTRRECLAVLTAVPAAAASAPPAFGAQLYTVRAPLRKEPDRILRAIADMGFRQVEGYNRLVSLALLPKLRQFGLALRSCAVETPLLTNNWEPFPELKPLSVKEAVDSLAEAGAEFFVMDYIPPGARGDGEDFFRRTADRMNAAAELCRKAGLKFLWRNHAFEFAGRPGLRPLDLYRERLDLKLVGMEADVFWLSMAGLDPVKMLKEWKGHVPAVRLNDRAKGTPGQFDESIGLGAYTEAGTGVIDFPAIVKAAPAAGVKFCSVGQDETEGDPLESLRKSWTYLKNL